MRHADAVWIFECKRDGDAGGALAQIQEKGYAGCAGGAEKYRDMDLPIHQVAVTFSEETRNIAAFEARSL